MTVEELERQPVGVFESREGHRSEAKSLRRHRVFLEGRSFHHRTIIATEAMTEHIKRWAAMAESGSKEAKPAGLEVGSCQTAEKLGGVLCQGSKAISGWASTEAVVSFEFHVLIAQV